ncbi:MAG: hypothetical protein RBS80_05120 [Thermoguttaceae bacterium]|jgi:hypothetical protein|nr:hypothetical protein [Thermoguttaceae bacterium]
MIVRLIREAPFPAASGPFQGQYVLQKALRRYGPAWLKIGGTLGAGEIPWFWCWEDAQAACRCAAEGRPFILGPNVLFHNSRRPRQFAHERLLCDAASCKLLLTESGWYRELIARHLGPANRAPIAVWPYPVLEAGRWELEVGDALARSAAGRVSVSPASSSQLLAPNSQLPSPISQLLVYAKSGFDEALLARIERRFPGSMLLRYGRFRREELLDAARGARACVYFSDDDRGPLALAEILLCGCPAVGVPRGAPWIEHGRNGAVVSGFDLDEILRGIALAMQVDRASVAAAARRRFCPRAVVRQIVTAIEGIEH